MCGIVGYIGQRDAVEFLDTAFAARRCFGRAGQRGEFNHLAAAAAEALRRTGFGNFLDDAVPLAAGLALAGPFVMGRAAGLADV